MPEGQMSGRNMFSGALNSHFLAGRDLANCLASVGCCMSIDLDGHTVNILTAHFMSLCIIFHI